MKKLTLFLTVTCFILSVALPSWSAATKKKTATQLKPAKKTVLTHKAPKGLPDLIVSISAPHVIQAGNKIPTCKVIVKNIGNGIARGTKTAGSNGYMVDITLSSNGHIPVTLASYSPNFSDDVLLKGGRISVTPDLKPNQSKVFKLNNVLVIPADTPQGAYCLGGVVDSGKKVKESNERNNTTCSKLKVKAKAKPDLIVKDIKVVKDCWLKVTVKNIGTAGLPDWVYAGPNVTKAAIQMYMDGGPFGGMIIKMFDPAGILKTPGASVTKLWFKGSPGLQLPPGVHSVKAVVDVHGEIDELNETNNTLTRRLKCRNGQQQRPLQVTNLVNSQSYKIVGNKIQITVEFNKNVKKATLVPKANFRVRTEKDANADGSLVWVNNRKLVWTSVKNKHDLCIFDSDCFFDLTITDSVEDTAGGKLDGDKNGVAGGDFHHNFTIIG